MSSENLPWFLSSAVLVAISQAFVYASLAVAPLMVVTPILELSLVFRLFLSQWINRDYEIMNAAVLVGALTAVLGSILVSLDTDVLMKLLDLPPSLRFPALPAGAWMISCRVVSSRATRCSWMVGRQKLDGVRDCFRRV